MQSLSELKERQPLRGSELLDSLKHRGSRIISQLRWAELVTRSPHPKVRLRGTKARGKAYERQFQRHFSSSLPSEAAIFHNQWIEFADCNGTGYAQPDSYLVLKSRVICFECKLTETLAGYRQLTGLYYPLLLAIYERPVVLVLTCKNLSRLDLRRIEAGSLREALLAPATKGVITFQWLP
jgi:hypothetical protein